MKALVLGSVAILALSVPAFAKQPSDIYESKALRRACQKEFVVAKKRDKTVDHDSFMVGCMVGMIKS